MQTEPVLWNKKAFNRLVLDQQNKELIRALVSVHLGSKITGDIIAGKGNGLIILLHGSPGVGKTLTAERFVTLFVQNWFLFSYTERAQQCCRACGKASIPCYLWRHW